MSARSGSLAWVVLAGAISFMIAGGLWGLLDKVFVGNVTALDVWTAPADSVPATGRAYVIATWNWFPLIVLLRLSADAIVAARLRGASSNVLFATIVLFGVHLMLIVWMMTFPEIGSALYDYSTNNATGVDQLGYDRGIDLAWNWGIGIIPAVLLLIADIWYLSAPVRDDLLRR